MSGAVEGVALLPCPFCGAEERNLSNAGNECHYTVVCEACDAEGPWIGFDPKVEGSFAAAVSEAHTAWNTRTTPSARSYADEDVARIIDTMMLNADDTAPSEDYRQGVRDTVETYRIAADFRLLSQGGKA